MTIRKILIEPNKILRQKSKSVEKVDREVQQLMDDMLDSMYAAPGIGLAAIQIGIPKRVIAPDAKYNSALVSKFINFVMERGKKKYSFFLQ